MNNGAFQGISQDRKPIPPGINAQKSKPLPGSMVCLTPSVNNAGSVGWSFLGLGNGGTVFIPFSFQHSFSFNQVRYYQYNGTGNVRFGIYDADPDTMLPDLETGRIIGEVAAGGAAAKTLSLQETQVEAGAGYALAMQLSDISNISFYSHDYGYAPYGFIDAAPNWGGYIANSVLTKSGAYASGLPSGPDFVAADLRGGGQYTNTPTVFLTVKQS